MNEALALDPATIPTLKPARPPPRRPEMREGEIWHVKMPGQVALICCQIDELTQRTVVLRRKSDVGMMFPASQPALRYDRRDIKFVEQVPE